MNDMSKKSSALFTPSGCLTGDALMLFVSGSLKGAALLKAQKHIAECPLCADAAEGLRLWLKENKPDESSNGLNDSLNSEDSGLAGKQLVTDVHSNKTAVHVQKFHARTDKLNERINQRLHTHAIIEANEKKRLSYKPFIWFAAAACVVILIGSFFVVWIQNQYDSEKLAKQRADEMAMLESQISYDSLDVTMPAIKTVLALKDNNAKGIPKSAETKDAKMLNQDELNVVPQVARTATTKKAVAADDNKTVFTLVEEMPSFPGGEIERNKFLAENIIYPHQAVESGIQGTVYISFIVNTDGKIEDIKILRGIGGGCDEEALRVVKLMPRWKPGKQSGKPVRVLFNMPVYFKLQ